MLALAAAIVPILAGGGFSAARAGELYAHGALTLHGGPGEGFASLTTLDAGTRIDVLWCNAASWCLVQHQDGQGWVPIAGLKTGKGAGADQSSTAASGPASGVMPAAGHDAIDNSAGVSAAANSAGASLGGSVSGAAAAASVTLH